MEFYILGVQFTIPVVLSRVEYWSTTVVENLRSAESRENKLKKNVGPGRLKTYFVLSYLGMVYNYTFQRFDLACWYSNLNDRCIIL